MRNDLKDGSRFWIFQGNPNVFDLNTYLKQNQHIVWSLRQDYYRDQVQAGDQVFIWRSEVGKHGYGGIVALCKVTGEVYYGKDDDESKPLWNEIMPDSQKWRVPLVILEQRLETGYLRRVDLKTYQPLSTLQILRFSQMTNYLLEINVGRSLLALWKHCQYLDSSESLDAGVFPEGRLSWLVHRTLELQQLLDVRRHKRKRFTDSLVCKACGLNLDSHYEEGPNIAELHLCRHIDETSILGRARPHELAVVCPTCHRALHLHRPWLEREELSQLIMR